MTVKFSGYNKLLNKYTIPVYFNAALPYSELKQRLGITKSIKSDDPQCFYYFKNMFSIAKNSDK